jgi:Transport protein Avl9
MVVSFHHRNGPQVEFCIPPFPKKPGEDDAHSEGEGVTLPEEWSFMPFMCLPDGAHSSEEEFIYFHLPPVDGWAGAYQKTLFGLACFRQIDSKDLLNKTADVTRTKVQKSVVVLASHCALGSVRSKLGLVTQAFFAQRDFSKIEIIENLYDNLNGSLRLPLSDATLFMGLSLRELIFKFKQKTLQLFKLLLLGKRVIMSLLF